MREDAAQCYCPVRQIVFRIFLSASPKANIIVWTNVIFAVATLASLAIFDYNFKKDGDKFLYVLGGIALIASVACFIMTSEAYDFASGEINML
jgi:hypothetical protein